MTEHDQSGRADRLETILQTITSSQQTGICHVERGKGGVRESGEIIFLFGQVVEATAGERNGVDALNRLTAWGNCSYIFSPRLPSEIIITPPTEAEPAPATHSPLSFISQIIPNIHRPASKNTHALEDAPQAQTHAPVEKPAPPPPASTTFSQSFQLPQTPQQFSPLFPEERGVAQPTPDKLYPTPMLKFPDAPTSVPPTPDPRLNSTRPHTPDPRMNTNYPHTPDPRVDPAYPHTPDSRMNTTYPHTPDPRLSPAYTPPVQVPYRVCEGPEALAFMDRFRIARTHRHVFLLVDGRRSVNDIARITGHSLDTTRHILAELERYGLIKHETMSKTFNW